MKMKSYILIFFLFVGLETFSQNGNESFQNKNNILKDYKNQYNVVDTAKVEIVYAHSILDPVLKKKDLKYEMLSLGDSHSLYSGYGNYQIDSLMNSRAGEKYSFQDYREWSSNFEPLPEMVMKNYNDSTLYFKGIIFGDSYYYNESIPMIEWRLSESEDDIRDIMGYQCRKATAKWRGRDWTAWYSDEIPYNEGPWKFGGLPGLVMQLEDSTGEHKFKVVGLKSDLYPFGLKKTSKPFKSKRERYNAQLKDHKENAAQRFSESGMIFGTVQGNLNKSKKRLFFSPIELE